VGGIVLGAVETAHSSTIREVAKLSAICTGRNPKRGEP
jgi:hypothetical protein